MLYVGIVLLQHLKPAGNGVLSVQNRHLRRLQVQVQIAALHQLRVVSVHKRLPKSASESRAVASAAAA